MNSWRHISLGRAKGIPKPTMIVRNDFSGGMLIVFLCHVLLAFGCSKGKSSTPAEDEPQETVTAKQAGVRISSVFSKLSSGDEKSSQTGESTSRTMSHNFAFRDVTARVGLDFHYDNGARGQQLMVEATGGGCGWIDYEHDGFIDIYFPQGGDPARSGAMDQPIDRLFRNKHGQVFQDVTEAAGIRNHDYGQGVAVGDFDSDGFDDLFVTNVGQNQLYHNQGDGSFEVVPAEAGFQESLWSTSAAWGDVDRDGDLDLYVCNYCDYDPRRPMPCADEQGTPSICHPKDVNPVPDQFYRNLGDGRFEACARSLGLFGPGNRGLGVVIADFNNDRWPDIYVANDTTANFLFLSENAVSFREAAGLLGCAVNAQGVAQASMGVGCGDYDGNGFLDLYLTHFTNEWNTLYTNLGDKGFYDTTAIAGLVVPTMKRLAFGTIMNDLNQDGRMELFVANGHINPQESGGSGYRMTPQLFSYNGVTWDDVGDSAGDYFKRPVVGRGIGTGDFDNDGKLDLCVVHHDCPIVLLQNECQEGTWLQVRLIGRQSARSAVGTRVSVQMGSVTQMQELVGGTSYCSAVQSQLNFASAEPLKVGSLRIEWTNGETSLLENVPLNQAIVVTEPSSPQQAAKWAIVHGGGE
jgi:enediyne biosynthesis protein E4